MRAIRIFLVFIIIFVHLCRSCASTEEKTYYCDVETVESVQIVHFEGFEIVDGVYLDKCTVLSEVADKEEFINRLNAIESHFYRVGPPIPLASDVIAIRISYISDGFDLLNSDAQIKNRDGINHSGRFYFEQEPFDQLIADYYSGY